MVEGTALEMRHMGNRIVSSNLTISAVLKVKHGRLVESADSWLGHKLWLDVILDIKNKCCKIEN